MISQHPDTRETGNSNVLDSGREEKLLIEMMTTLFGDKSDDGDDTV